MTTTFDALRRACGLALCETAGVFGVQLATVKSWSRGRRSAPPRILRELAEFDGQMERAATEIIALITQTPPASVINLSAASDAEARALGLPGLEAHVAMLGRVAARLIAHGYRVEVE